MADDTKFIVEIQWHQPDQAYAAVLLRDGQPWYLGGALVGMGTTPGAAVQSLTDLARFLVIHGINYLTVEPLPLADREWLYGLFGTGPGNHEIWQALRAAGSEVY